jgi:uncharacterized protein (DUF952 family)
MAWHLVAELWFRNQPASVDYVPEAFAADGFVHLTHGASEVIAAGNRYYRSDPRHYLALRIDLRRIASEIRYDDPQRQFPHVYGPIERAAIVDIHPVLRDELGGFVEIG